MRRPRSKRAPPGVIDYTSARELYRRIREIEQDIGRVSGDSARVLAVEYARLMRAWWRLPNADVSTVLWGTISRRGRWQDQG